MRFDSVIDLTQYVQHSPAASASSAPVHSSSFRLRRRCMRLVAAVEAAVTVCIGAGFLVCLGLIFSML